MSALDPSSIPITGPGTPYITPEILKEAPTGIAWNTIPQFRGTPDQQEAAQFNICQRATSQVDGACFQPLRATVNTEQWMGPGSFRCQTMGNGVTRLLTSRRPVTSIVSGQFSASAAFPRNWQSLDADQFDVEQPTIGQYGSTAPGSGGDGGQAILVAPGVVPWTFGRQSTLIQVTFVSCWPHASLTVAADETDTEIAVDDITGWDGAGGVIFDGTAQEAILVTAVTPTTTGAITGPGILTLSTPLAWAHQVGTLVSTMPAAVQEATILFATAEALVRGATSTTSQTVSPGAGGGGPTGPAELRKTAREMLAPFRVVI